VVEAETEAEAEAEAETETETQLAEDLELAAIEVRMPPPSALCFLCFSSLLSFLLFPLLSS
jgi:hypothetical protein